MLELIEREGFAVPFPIEVRAVAPDDALLSTAAGRDSGFVAVHMFRGMEWEPYFRAVEAIMDGSTGARTGASATSRRPRRCVRAIPSGTASRPCARAWTRTGASPTSGPIACWARSRRAGDPGASALADGRARVRGAWSAPPRPWRRRSRWSTSTRWANAADMERRAARKPIRLASKSLRCRALQERVLARPGFAGTLAFTLPEALWLAERASRTSLVAYPTADRDARCARWRARRARRPMVT